MKDILKKFSDLPDIQIQVPGKWILAGEHSVLRGGNALVFPLTSRYLLLNYYKSDSEFELSLDSESHPELELTVWSVLERALKKLNLKRSALKGTLTFDSRILFGSGMGASATLCVALTKWFCQLGYLKPEERYDFARDLENLFHGESSGVDVAVTLHNQPLLFSRHNGFQLLQDYCKPLLYLSHTGERGVTKDCVDKVKKLFTQNKEKAEHIDAQMIKSVELFQSLLQEKKISSERWIQAMQLAHACFYEWGLVNDAVRTHEEELLRLGAQAIKLTGSGGGGFMLSYWTEPPPQNVTFEMIPCFNDSSRK
jgi:mevalonate kinase